MKGTPLAGRWEEVRARPWALVLVVSFALFMDYLIYGAVLPLMAYAPGSAAGEEHLGLLAAAYAAGVLGATPLFGWMGERKGCRVILIQGVVLAGVATLLFAVAPNFAAVAVARFLQGSAAAATWIAGLAFVAERYSGRRVEMMGYALMGSTGGAILGPLLGGYLYGAGGYALPFVVLLALIAVEAVCCILLLPRDSGHPGEPHPLLAILLDWSVAVPAVAVALAAAGWGILEPLLPVHLARLGESGAGDIGVLFAAATIVYGVATPGVSWLTERIGVPWTVTIGMIAMALTLPLVSLSHQFGFILAGLCLVGISFALLLNPTSAELGEAVERRGMVCFPVVYSVYNIAYAVGMLGTSSFAAAIAARVGLLNTLLLVSAGLLVCAPAMLLATRPAGTAMAPRR
jgi:MFS transporter, DHA1 family, solute carrier family 18 (vesicular amine transporter), member 1/2